jgi:hypothetical protein
LYHVSVPISPRQQRHLAFISEFNVQMLYLLGLENIVADILSHPSPPPVPESPETVAALAAADQVDFEAMVAEQNRSAEMQRLFGGSSLQLAFHQAGTQHLAGDVSTGIFRPIVPKKFRKDISSNFHNNSHPGRLAFLRLVSSRFV